MIRVRNGLRTIDAVDKKEKLFGGIVILVNTDGSDLPKPLACIILSVFWPLPTQALLNSCFVRAFHMDFLERPTCPGNEFYYWIDLLYRPKELACCSTTRKEEENDIYNEIEVCSRTDICEKAELTPSTCT